MNYKGLRKLLAAFVAIAITIIALFLSGCGSSAHVRSDINYVEALASQVTDTELPPVDYMVLINKQNAMPEGWDEYLLTDTVNVKGSDNDVQVERNAYDAYLSLKSELEKEGIYIDIMAAKPVFGDIDPNSEYSTGLALDLCLVVDGEVVTDHKALLKYDDIWKKIHEKLYKYEFIVRCPKGQEDVTGYSYEPWHIRYIRDGFIAREIMASNSTLEEHLGVAEEAREANIKAREEAEAERARQEEEAAAAEEASYNYDGYSYNDSYYGNDIYRAEYNPMYNEDGPTHSMPGWHDGYLETYYNASSHYLASTWTLDDEGFYHDANGRYVVGVDISHQDEMPYGTVVETGKGEGVVYDYGSGAEVHDFATNWQ